ncbi:MAG TPA: hypothetical protein V6D21_14480 [Candidatus Obscuribacterales bacterium]
MVAIVSPPAAGSTSVDVTQKKLGTVTKTSTVLAATVAADIIESDETAGLGRKILSINNTSATESVKIALGRVATATDYDFILYPSYQLLDIDWNAESVSAISTGTLTVITTIARYEEI